MGPVVISLVQERQDQEKPLQSPARARPLED